ncbi:MAG: tetratricopeptide repeat protein [bacterium]|nr:tetratricopeptide repeat protein [bacterium]
MFILLVGVYFYIIRGELAKKAWADFHNSTVALFFDTDDAGFAMNIGNYYFNGTIGGGEYNPDLAQKAYKKAVSINPKILWGHYQLSRIAFVKGDYERALEEIKKELEANPQNLRSLYVRGLVYGYRNKSGDLELAENDFRRFTYWAPSEWAGYNDLAWILFKEGKYAEAEMELGRAFENIQVADKNPWLLNALGVARLNLGNKSGAGEAFLNALAEAEKLTANEWRASYPGNNPLSAEDGLKKFLETLKENIWRAKGA